ncbi:CRISPR system precrRNA processing endoribonuclease RAMP protein Cas6 [Nitrosomonas sp. wSCUT-2]
MILLELQVTLQKNQHQPAVAASPFLGGVLHGVLERLVRLHAPVLGGDLGITPGSGFKHYAILPPPYGWRASDSSTSIVMACGIVLYGPARQHAQAVAKLLGHWHTIDLNGRKDRVERCRIRYHAPGTPVSPWQDPATNIPDPQPDFTHTPHGTDGITLNFFTPLTLGDLHKTAQGQWMPPKLLRIVRSLTRRIGRVEPDLAAALNIGSMPWIEAEEQIRRQPVVSHRLTAVQWQYGSSTKQNPFHCRGLVGQITYARPMPPAIAALLHWGAWFGAGESPALGQGLYHTGTPLIDCAATG